MSPSLLTHATTYHWVALTSKMESDLQFPIPRSNGIVAIRPGTVLSSLAMALRSFVTCRLGEDSAEPVGTSANDPKRTSAPFQ